MAAYDNIRNMRDDTTAQLRHLREQVNALMEDRVSPMMTDAAEQAQYAAKRAQRFTTDQAAIVSDRVRDQPLIAIGVAAAVGYALGRLLPR
jgi:ElaB/YqjD/DUF883 family membrane-anchored ribosome-binding protein